MKKLKQFISYVMVFILVTLSGVTDIVPFVSGIEDAYADSTQWGDPDIVNTGHNYPYNKYDRVPWGSDGWVANSTADRTLYIDLYDSNKTLKKTLSFAANFSIKDLGLPAETTEEFIYENEWLNGKEYSYAVVRCPGAFVQRNEANESTLYSDRFAKDDSDKHAHGEWTKVWESDRDIEHGHGGLHDWVGSDVYYKNYFMVWGETYNDSGYIKYTEGKNGFDSYNYFVSKGQSYTSLLNKININSTIYRLQHYKSLCAHIPFYTTNYINLRDTDTGKIREKQAFRGFLCSKWLAGGEDNRGELTMESFLIGLRLDETAPAITVSPNSSTTATTIKITMSDTGSGVKSGYANGYQYYWSQSNTELKGGSWKSWSNNIKSSSDSSIVSKDITVEGAYLWLKGASDNVGNVGNSGTECTIKTINNQTYYVYGPYSKEYTQTLYFYNGTSIFDTKTYSVKYGDTFDAYAHRLDAGTPTGYHYSSIDTSFWTVTGAASTNVRFAINTQNIVYNANGATGGSTAGTTVNYGYSFNAATNGFIWPGHTFTGWKDVNGNLYTPGTAYTVYPDSTGAKLTLYAQWSLNSHSVTLNKGTGISSVSGGGTKSYGERVTISASVKTGYTWSEWTGSVTTTDNPYTFNMPDHAMTFTANATPNNYTVTFDARNGTSNLSSLTVTYDSVNCNDIASYSTTRDGYEFNGWKDINGNPIWDKSGHCVNGNYWNNSKQWKYAGNVTAYADWIDRTPPEVTVTPGDSGGVWVTTKDITINVTDNEALSGSNSYQYCLCTNSSSPSGAWVSYTNGLSFTIGGGLTGEYYLWVKSVSDEKGNNSSSTGFHKFGPYYFDNTAPDLSKVNLTYGWYKEGTTISFDISDFNSGISSIILNDFNGIKVADITTSKAYRFDTSGANFYYIVATDILGNTVIKPFMVKIDKTGEVIRDNAVWKGLNDLKVFAIWLANKYTVRFDKNDNDGGSTRATGTMADIVLKYDKTTKLPANGYTRVGYDFTGWSRSSDGTSEPFSDEASVKNLTVNANEVITLFAQWKASSYNLTFNYNKPSNSTGVLKGGTETSRVVKYDERIGKLPEPTISGWAFDGWYVNGKKITADTVWKYTSDQVAVAKWTAVKYEVRLHSSQPETALSAIVRTNPTGWVWNSAGYYSAVFTYDVESTLPVPSNVYSLVEYTVNGWYWNASCTSYAGNGTKVWNLTSVNGGVVDLYPAWRDSTGPRITVTPEKTTNAHANNNAVRNIDVTIKIEELGSGLSADNKYEYGFTTSSTSTPVTWEKYSSTTGTTGFTVTLPELGKSKNGYYYLWVKQISDRSGNLSTSTMEVSNTRACHVYGIYVFDNAAPTGTVKYIENNAMLGLYGTSAIDNPYAVMTVEDASDAIAGVEELKLVIADFDNASNKAEFEFVKESGVYKCSFNLYDCLVNPAEVEQVSMKVIAVDKVGNTGILPVTSYDFGRKQDGTPIRDSDIGFVEVIDDSTDNDNDGEDNDSDDDKYFIRDAFRVEAAIHDIMGDTQFAKGQLGMVDIYTFGGVETIAVDFGSLNNYVNKINGVHLPEYQWDATIDLVTTVVNHGKTGFYTHEFYVPLYAAESTYTDTVVTGTKGPRGQFRNLVFSVSGTILDDIKTILKYGTD